MKVVVLALAGPLLVFAQAPAELDACLERISGQAAALAKQAPLVIGRETMRQKAMVATRPAKGFQVRGTEEPPVQLVSHELVAEYGFAALPDAPGDYHEMRQVISVDGKPLNSPAKARQALVLGLTGADAKQKRQMLESLTRHGLAEVAVDFGQSLLLFERAQLANYRFEMIGQQQIGADEAVVIEFHQKPETAGRVTVYENGRPTQQHALQGRIWARRSDCLPLRVRLSAVRLESKRTITDEGTVDYAESAFGSLLPATVTHRKLVDGKMITETVSEFSGFQKFSAETQIEFQPPQ